MAGEGNQDGARQTNASAGAGSRKVAPVGGGWTQPLLRGAFQPAIAVGVSLSCGPSLVPDAAAPESENAAYLGTDVPFD